jgi:hypothetical protein
MLFVILHSHQTIGERVVAALVAGIAVELMGVIGMIAASVAAERLLGQDDQPSLPPIQHLLAGMLLATCVWIWWQYNRESVIRDVAHCVDRKAHENVEYDARDAVLACYGDHNSADYDDAN